MATEYRLLHTAEEIDEKLSKIDELVTIEDVDSKTSDTLAMAKSYTDSQRLGYADPGEVITYDGNESAEFIELNGARLVRLSDGVFDLRKVKKIKCVLANGGQVLEFSEEDFEMVSGDGITAISVAHNGHTLPAVFVGDAGGLYGYAQEGIGYLSYVEFAETIHPIDPKYIPAMDSITLNGADGKQYELKVDGSGKLSVTVKNTGGGGSGMVIPFNNPNSYTKETVAGITNCFKISDYQMSQEEVENAVIYVEYTDMNEDMCTHEQKFISVSYDYELGVLTGKVWDVMHNETVILVSASDGTYLRSSAFESWLEDAAGRPGNTATGGEIRLAT